MMRERVIIVMSRRRPFCQRICRTMDVCGTIQPHPLRLIFDGTSAAELQTAPVTAQVNCELNNAT